MQNIDSDLIRGNIDTIILKTMLSGDMYGLDIIKEVENKSNGTYELKQPTLYSCLKRLENQELISSYWLDSDIGGKRHYYKLTEKGHDVLSKKQEEWSKSKFIIDNLLGDFNSDEYRLVKKDDYDKIIEGKKFEYNEEDSKVNLPNNVDAEEKDTVTIEVPKKEASNYSQSYLSRRDIFAPNQYDKPYDETDFVFQPTTENQNYIPEFNEAVQESISQYDETHNTYKKTEDYLLSVNKNTEYDSFNDYNNGRKVYAKQVEEKPKEVIQQNLLDQTFEENDPEDVDSTLEDFEKHIEMLNKFKNQNDNLAEDEEEENEIEEFKANEIAEEYELGTAKDDDYSINFEDAETEDFETTSEESSENEQVYQNNFLDELSELGGYGYQNDYSAAEDENKVDEPAKVNYSNTFETNEPEADDYEETPITEETSEEVSYNTDDGYIYDDNENPIEKIETADELWNIRDTSEDNYSFEDCYYEEQNPNQTFHDNLTASKVSQTSFDDIISKNGTAFTPVSETPSFVPVSPSEPYKQKLQNLSAYSKFSTEKNEGIEKAKDINLLKEEFEKEGIKVTQFKKDVLDDSEKNYLLVNKMNLIKSLILLFGYVFILSALYIILASTSFKAFNKNFSFIYFLYGFIPFGIYAIYSVVMYLMNPYKKIPAKYATGIMFFISAIITVQLLLITYCVNLQLGFYSFTQSGYNHLGWIIPLVISFAPLASTGIHTALFYSRNFNV